MSDFTAEDIAKYSKNEKEIYGFARTMVDGLLEDFIVLSLYGAQSKTDIAQIFCPREKFLFEFPEVFKNSKLKAFIFQIDGIPQNLDFMRISRINMIMLNIPVIYFKTSEYLTSMILAAANLSLRVNDRIVEVLINKDGYGVSELIYTEKGFLECDRRDCKPYKKITPEAIRHRILGPNNPVKIICRESVPVVEPTKFLVKKVLSGIPSSKWILFGKITLENDRKFVFETVKWMFDKSYTKFHVCTKSFRNYMISIKYDGKYFPLMICKKGDILPFKKTVIIPKSFLQYSRTVTDHNDIDIIEMEALEIPKAVHALQFTLEVDESNFTGAYNKGLVYRKISRLPAQLDAKDITFPVIGFCGELSFIYVKEKDGGYKFLDTWNGKLGKDLYISFDQEKPIFFEKAVEKFLNNRNSVIHDVIKIMATPLSELSSLQTIGYSITSDSDHPILMQMENSQKEKKSATPTFFMAMLLKEHLKELKAKLGEKPNKIGFCIFDDFDGDKEAKIRVENGLKEACQMLNGLECCFFEAV